MSKMVKQIATIQNSKGLHARASAQVVRMAESFQATTYICYQNMRVPAASIMGLLMLGAGPGATISIESEGNDADKAVSSLIALVNDKFGEN